ncbi:hypothetical protein [Natronorubrum thiooxidans]|nr:hypothetical protein [Natronorubrum thiooxidans]
MDPLSDHLKQQQTMLRQVVGVGMIGVALSIVALAIDVSGNLPILLLLGGIAVAGGGYVYVNSREPDVTVTGIDKAYWTGYCISDDAGVVVYDATESIDHTSFEIERLADEEMIGNAAEQLDELEEFPVVMPTEENIERTFMDTLERVRSEIDDAERHTLEMPVLHTDNPAANGITSVTDLVDDGQDSVDVNVEVTVDEAQNDIESLAQLNQIAAADDDEAKLEAVSNKSQQLVDDLSGMQETAIDLLNDHVGTAADSFGLVSYNFYCPDCLADDVESKTTMSDLDSGEWYCETCRSYRETEDIVPRHRIKDDVVNPVWDQLWIEKDDERREIYEKVEDQKRELQEREFEQRSEEIRSATDRIKDLRSRIRDLKTQAKAAEGTVEEIGSLMVKYDRINEERKREFRRDVEESFDQIDQRTSEILERMQNEQQKRLAESEQAAKEKAELLREEERRRDAEKFAAQQKLQTARKQAEMEKSAELHEAEMSVEKRHHRENWMLKTRGRTYIPGRINQMKMKKDRLTRASVRTDGGEN